MIVRRPGHRLILCLFFALGFLACGEAEGNTIDFNRQVRPLLANYCFECHGPDPDYRKADLRLDTFGGATESVVVPGKPDESLFWERLTSHDVDDRMPPPESPRQPQTEHIEILRQWIAEGASYDEHWAFQPIKRVEIRGDSHSNWAKTGLDSIVLEKLHDMGLRPRLDAPPSVLARRLSLALTGLPALPEQIKAFEEKAAQSLDRAIEEWVDALLASEAYGEHFAWSWMDAARYADTNGYQGDQPRVMWPWRDWLASALNENLPFDQLTERMLAGDLLVPESQAQWETGGWIPDARASDLVAATGFFRNHRYDSGSGTIAAEAKFVNATDRLETFSTVWLGLTMQCARCHSHKFDPIEQPEYYELLSFFDKVPEVGEALKQASHPYIHTPTPTQRAELNQLQRARQEARDAFQEARDRIETEQAKWEKQVRASDPSREEKPRVLRGMQFRYAAEPLMFDGETLVEKDKQAIALCAGNRPWTIAFWFRPENQASCAIFSSVEEPERYRFGIQADWEAGKIRIRHVSRWVNSYIEFESVKTLSPNEWYHVSFRCDGRIQGLAYSATLNGSEAAMTMTKEIANNSSEKAGKAPLILGGSPFLPNFEGTLRDLQFYDRVLSPIELSSLAEGRTTEALVRISEANRSEVENEILRLAFLESDVVSDDINRLRDSIFETEAAFTAALKKTSTTMVMRDASLGRTRLHAMGAYDRPTVEVETNTPSILPPFPESAARNRLSLARWLARPEHPLTARVAVNRLWQLLWGEGFVSSPENFGTQCAAPDQAELLDWLASEYMRLGWNTKALIKLIVTSRSYRQDSSAPDSLWQTDPSNRFLARGPRFRLPVHVIRDQALALSGRLDPVVGGPPVVLDEVLGKDGKPVALEHEYNNRRRTIYTFWKRNAPHPMLKIYDVADRNQCDVRTRRTNTPLQALATLNEPGLVACAQALGQRAVASGDDDGARLRWIWKACTGRAPDPEQERQLRKSLVAYQSFFPGDPEQQWTALANVVLNLDATLTLE